MSNCETERFFPEFYKFRRTFVYVGSDDYQSHAYKMAEENNKI